MYVQYICMYACVCVCVCVLACNLLLLQLHLCDKVTLAFDIPTEFPGLLQHDVSYVGFSWSLGKEDYLKN